ncbi:MAG: hypothetical protein A2075_10455 [Geobacteraceae bacterium GWC2_58_44]|nr:MAG: hypothetical protein A2075_10455 [Geobacteraceae bacterium GWC2_58_44]HBG07723.1 hypothetical protein [Geobacter sp.]
MSSILKALEKVEESQNTRRDGGAGGFKKGRERRRAWLMPAGILGGAAVATLVTFAAMGGFSRSAAPVQEVKAVVKPAPVVVAPLYPVTEGPAAQPEQTLPVEPEEVVAVPNPKASPAPAPTLTAMAAAKPKRVTAGAIPVLRPSSLRPSPLQAVSVPTNTPVQAAPAAVEAPPVFETEPQLTREKPRAEFRVTGIAWQKDSASSAAIVNGRSVQQGSMVNGYKIEAILEDKVIFSSSSGKLEVLLGAGE